MKKHIGTGKEVKKLERILAMFERLDIVQIEAQLEREASNG